MAKYKLRLDTLRGADAFSEASREELRTLLALISLGGEGDIDTLTAAAGVSAARAKASLVLWEEAGVIIPTDEIDAPTVTEEFSDTGEYDIKDAITSAECADTIRDNNLQGLISELARLMGKAALSSGEAKLITTLYTELMLSEEYILTLAGYMLDKKGRLSAKRLSDEAERLAKRDIDTAEALEIYFSEKEKESGDMWEVKRLLGIYNRTLSKKEREIVERWLNEYGYSLEVVGEAYDITVLNTGKLSMPYMDKLISHWHSSGAKTLSEIRVLVERERAQKAHEAAPKTPPRMPRTPREKPRFGDFDATEVFERVLARSYGDDDDEEDDE